MQKQLQFQKAQIVKSLLERAQKICSEMDIRDFTDVRALLALKSRTATDLAHCLESAINLHDEIKHDIETHLTPEQILEREFRAHGDIVGKITVEFTEDEEIRVWTEYELFMMLIDSDDNNFHFVGDQTGREVKFPFPPDWPA